MSEQKKFVPFVSAETNMTEFTVRALIIGLIMAVVLGAANAYLGLRAGMTIAATYPAAVIGMAILKTLKGSILEENFARTVGSIGESVAAGAIFTLPAFFVSGIWPEFFTVGHYMTSSLILIAGGILGIMFVALLRRVMVEDVELKFPESIAAAEIHKAGRRSGGGSKFLFGAMAGGAIIQALGQLKFFATSWEKFITFSKQTITGTVFSGKGGLLLSSPGISPAYMGVGYIIGPKYGALNFSGGLIAWGLLAPMIYYFISPSIDMDFLTSWASMLQVKDPTLSDAAALEKVSDSTFQITQIWRFIVRPIAIGGMLMGACFTLFKMRKSLGEGIRRAVGDVRKVAGGGKVETVRTEKDIPFTWIIIGILFVACLTFFITFFVFEASLLVSIVAATLLIVLAFLFGAVSGYLVGIMGSSNNPISGLTLTALVTTALILVALGVHGDAGVATVLGVAAIVCVSAAVAGEMLQDLKAGHILGGTPWRMQIGDIIGVILAGSVMFGVLVILNQGDIAQGLKDGYDGGFGSKNLPAPQASLMAMLSKGIVSGQMAWPLIIVGMLMGLAFILMQVKSPMLVSVGMYLPLETTFAIFLGGCVKGILEMFNTNKKENGKVVLDAEGNPVKKYSKGQMIRMDNIGILLASGFIAGEALMGLVFALLYFMDVPTPAIFENPSFFISMTILTLIAFALIYFPLKNKGDASEPPPPSGSF
ncbi:MAG TPA: oligopeptide transporter, OPT family [Bacteroidales bacterium]|nr:oligopeptide transporter, OPT family [Bacteroidales bacterium]HPS18162.1 oligopeptide transporter, OPT family [Bacteroidales bacterium]